MATNATNRRANQGVWIDAGFTSMNVSTLFLPGQLGMVITKDGISYQCVQFKSTTSAVVAGTAVMWSDMDDFVVSALVSDAKRNYIAGVALGTMTAAYYGWIQVAGPGTVLFAQGSARGGTDTAAGEVAIMSATDGQVDRVAAGTAPTYFPLGVFTAVGTGTSTPVAVLIDVPHNSW